MAEVTMTTGKFLLDFSIWFWPPWKRVQCGNLHPSLVIPLCLLIDLSFPSFSPCPL